MAKRLTMLLAMGHTYIRDGRTPIPKKEAISRIMSANKGKGTSLELRVRKAISSAGFKGYRLNWSKIPGRPDIAFVKHKVAIIINGCFWHGCRRCTKDAPKTNRRYWSWKIESNKKRDRRNTAQLKRLGWRFYRVWEHDVKKGNLSPLLAWLEDSVQKRV